MPRIFLDNHSTTPVDPRVLDAMLPYFSEHFGNPASRSHAYGWDASSAVQAARESVAALVGAVSSKEVVFTSGATESNNLALKGALEFLGGKRNRAIVSAIEHKSVLDTAAYLGARGFHVTLLPVNSAGTVEPEALRHVLSDETAIVSVMLANNEVGTVQPVAELASLAHERGAWFHVDAAQGLGTVDFDVERMNIDLASFSAHKIYGPKGCGALYVRSKRPRVQLAPQMLGGGHEQGLRSGTLNVPAIVGFGRACDLLREEGDNDRVRIASLRDELEARLLDALPHIRINGNPLNRLAGNCNVIFSGIESGTLMQRLGDVAVSSGSACSSATPEPSYVLTAMGLSAELARCSIRFGIGRFNTKPEVLAVAKRVVDVVQSLGGLHGRNWR